MDAYLHELGLVGARTIPQVIEIRLQYLKTEDDGSNENTERPTLKRTRPFDPGSPPRPENPQPFKARTNSICTLSTTLQVNQLDVFKEEP